MKFKSYFPQGKRLVIDAKSKLLMEKGYQPRRNVEKFFIVMGSLHTLCTQIMPVWNSWPRTGPPHAKSTYFMNYLFFCQIYNSCPLTRMYRSPPTQKWKIINQLIFIPGEWQTICYSVFWYKLIRNQIFNPPNKVQRFTIIFEKPVRVRGTGTRGDRYAANCFNV